MASWLLLALSHETVLDLQVTKLLVAVCFTAENKSAASHFHYTVPPESIETFAAFLPRGLHASLTQYSRTQPCLYLGKTKDGICPAAAAFGTRYYHGN